MSQVNVDTIRKSDGSAGTDIRIKNTSVYESDGGTSVTQNLVQGLAKNWLHHNAGSSITDSFNTSSVSDFGTGDHGATFTNNMNNANYVQVGSTIKGAGGPSASNVGLFTLGEGASTTGYGPCTVANDTNAADRSKVYSAVFGDLA